LENGDSNARTNIAKNKRSKRDQLEYMADLLLELKEMARENNLSTLEGILDIARTEANLQARETRKTY
jgi:hypothetical protein